VRWSFVAIVALGIALDQGSKAWARTLPVSPPGCNVPDDLIALRCGGVPQPVIDGYWDWELAYNPGAAFSSFTRASAARIILALIAAIAAVALTVAAFRTRPDQQLRQIALAMIAAGAVGNLIDRC
jgi:signal peptidase II